MLIIDQIWLRSVCQQKEKQRMHEAQINVKFTKFLHFSTLPQLTSQTS